MGKSMYNFSKQTKEKARQQKQIQKAAKRTMAKQQKTEITPDGATEEEGPAPIKPVPESNGEAE